MKKFTIPDELYPEGWAERFYKKRAIIFLRTKYRLWLAKTNGRGF
jgi:hypothetical protein